MNKREFQLSTKRNVSRFVEKLEEEGIPLEFNKNSKVVIVTIQSFMHECVVEVLYEEIEQGDLAKFRNAY